MYQKNALALATFVGISFPLNASVLPHYPGAGSSASPFDHPARRTVCVLNKSMALNEGYYSYSRPCTPEFLESDAIDGAECYASSCEVQEDGECPTYYVKRKTSRPVEATYCSYSRPMEL
ncbi:MAG: hypothetical protein EOP04_14220 [Proteobacteria bacterium]|nr:MAG: hypothetical protein EOP04_14220 [Pseudomonadota bacterium]